MARFRGVRKRQWVMVTGLVVALVCLAWLALTNRALAGRATWRQDAPPPMPPLAAGCRVLIFAPHEDDETLGAGGLIQQAVDLGCDVQVVLMTNGEYSELGTLVSEVSSPLQPEAHVAYGYLRQGETLEALQVLGVEARRVTFLGYPDQYVGQMWLPENWPPGQAMLAARTRTRRSPYSNSATPGALHCGTSVLADVRRQLLRQQPDVVIAVHPSDVHPDHWSTYAFVRAALEGLAADGAEFARSSVLYTYLIHRPPWPVPRGYKPWLPQEPPTSPADAWQGNWLSLVLTPLEAVRKTHAIRQYRSQTEPYAPLLMSFARSTEVFATIPATTWAAGAPQGLTLVDTDPVGDLGKEVLHPGADLQDILLRQPGAGQLLVEVTLHGSPSDHVTYHVSLHEIGRGGKVSAGHWWVHRGVSGGVVLSERKVRSLTSVKRKGWQRGRTVSLQLVKRPATEADGAAILRCWTQVGKDVVDMSEPITLEAEPKR